MCSISSRTNSPAWVLGDLPSSLSLLARSRVIASGIAFSSEENDAGADNVDVLILHKKKSPAITGWAPVL
jgi:hypothetical protein